MIGSDTVVDCIFELGYTVGCPDLASSILGKADRVEHESVVDAIADDHAALIARDPACADGEDYPLVPNAPFQAVLAHRVAHALWTAGTHERKKLAVAIQHLARVRTGVDIHPGATLGRRFVVDHGFGTVIGQTAVVGDDCYVLNGVTIGARGIGGNPVGKRHPTIGDRVEIGSFARLLGPIVVGSDVFVAPLSLVTRDVPSAARVRPGIAGTEVRSRPRPDPAVRSVAPVLQLVGA